jgi:hypothetical protein
MPPRAASPRPSKPKGGTYDGDDAPSARGGEGKTKKVSAKRSSSSRVKSTKSKGEVDENAGENEGKQSEPDRVRVFLKINADAGSSVSSCVTCDSKSKSAWALDFDGQRVGSAVGLDGVFSADALESQMYPELVNSLVAEFINSSRGVGTLLVYGQAEAGKEALMYGEAGSRMNMTPRSLPAPGGHQAQQQKAPGLVLAAFRAALSTLPQLAEQVHARSHAAPRAHTRTAGDTQHALLRPPLPLFLSSGETP